MSDALLDRADALAWDEGLRGFDAVHPASAMIGREGLGAEVVLAAYDLQLRRAAGRLQFATFPEDLPACIADAR